MTNYHGCDCNSCHQTLREGDDIVVCPECGAPYHRACYVQEGECVFSAKHGTGFEYQRPKSAIPGQECPACHTQNDADNIFCENCGRPLRTGTPHYTAASTKGSQPPQQPNSMWNAIKGSAFEPFSGSDVMQMDKEIDGFPAQDWATYIGESVPYYLLQFRQMDASGRKTTFCWSAFFFAPIYFFFRKMWGWGLLAIALFLTLEAPSILYLLETTGSAFAPDISLSMLESVTTICSLISWLVRFAWAIFAVYLYRQNVGKKLRAFKETAPDHTVYQETLTRHAGPSRIAAFVLLALFLAVSAFLGSILGPNLPSLFYY